MSRYGPLWTWHDSRSSDKVKTPMLVLGAANDFLIDSHELEQTARAYGTNPEVFANMAHDMMLDG
ncbi:hypothetical protein EXW96_18750 [Paenibacillus sp. JMULE4]|uniref:lysophospholipase n=1 Tax=Paenibacillus TaxID=44249 RepID=UPI001144E5C5|nr:lysophospholipase [Paenibacillus sp. JMULE4]NTZ19521.1 hypothetical protein [Paenibacillus sp. JMULE4]